MVAATFPDLLPAFHLQGNLTGAVELFDCALRRSRLKGKFDLVYVGPSQVMVTSLSTGAQCAVKSNYGMEIEKVRFDRSDRIV